MSSLAAASRLQLPALAWPSTRRGCRLPPCTTSTAQSPDGVVWRLADEARGRAPASGGNRARRPRLRALPQGQVRGLSRPFPSLLMVPVCPVGTAAAACIVSRTRQRSPLAAPPIACIPQGLATKVVSTAKPLRPLPPARPLRAHGRHCASLSARAEGLGAGVGRSAAGRSRC